MEHVLLWGPPGSGKSTAGPLVAARLQRPFVDLDDAIESAQGASIERIFRDVGETAFRRLEETTLAEVLSATRPLVVSLGGGTLVGDVLRRQTLREHRVVGLRARRDTLLARLKDVTTRPLLRGTDVASSIDSLLAGRADAYSEVHGSIDTDELRPDEVADRVVRAIEHPCVVVPLGRRSYVASIGRGVSSASLGDAFEKGERLSIFDERWAIANRETALVGRVLRGAHVGLDVHDKSLALAERIWSEASQRDLSKSAVFCAFGGGGTLDVAGFAAATWKRGVDWISVPTTALAMVDSCLGGKTGIDFAGRKNSVGVVHQPRHVLVDASWLDSLSDVQRRDGLVEALKCALLEGHSAMAKFESNVARIEHGDIDAWDEIIACSLRCKAQFVAADEHDHTVRRALNFGHTVGHALELTCGLSHGEAVAWGILAELRLALPERAQSLAALFAWTKSMFVRLGFVTSPRPTESEMRASLASDKKRRGDKIAVHMPNGDGGIEVRETTTDELVCAFFAPA